MNYEVIESRIWLRDDGAKASVYGAVPYKGEQEKARWKMVPNGWTVRNPLTGQVGIGRAPCETKEAAQALANKLGKPSAIGLGD